MYIGLMVGFAVGVGLSATVMDRTAMRRSEPGGGSGSGHHHKAENRLVPIVYASPLIPAGLLLYGWSLQAGLHFAVPLVGTALVGAGMVLTLVCFFLFFAPPPSPPFFPLFFSWSSRSSSRFDPGYCLGSGSGSGRGTRF